MTTNFKKIEEERNLKIQIALDNINLLIPYLQSIDNNDFSLMLKIDNKISVMTNYIEKYDLLPISAELIEKINNEIEKYNPNHSFIYVRADFQYEISVINYLEKELENNQDLELN